MNRKGFTDPSAEYLKLNRHSHTESRPWIQYGKKHGGVQISKRMKDNRWFRVCKGEAAEVGWRGWVSRLAL